MTMPSLRSPLGAFCPRSRYSTVFVNVERHALYPPRRARALTLQRGRLADDAKQHSEAHSGAAAHQILMVRHGRGRRRRRSSALTRRNPGARLRVWCRGRIIMESALAGSRCAPR